MTQNESLIDTSLVRRIFRRGSHAEHSEIFAATSYVSMTHGAPKHGAGWNTPKGTIGMFVRLTALIKISSFAINCTVCLSEEFDRKR